MIIPLQTAGNRTDYDIILYYLWVTCYTYTDNDNIYNRTISKTKLIRVEFMNNIVLNDYSKMYLLIFPISFFYRNIRDDYCVNAGLQS